MQPLTKSNQMRTAVNNRRLIVHLLRQAGPLSRHQLAQQTGLRHSSLTYITRELMQRNIIRINGKRDNPGMGKKQVLLEINPDLGWVLGVGVENDAASLVFLNAQGHVIDRDRMLLREPLDLFAKALHNRVTNWITRHGKPEGQLLGIGIGISGIVNPNDGVILRSTRFNLQNFNMAAAMQDVFSVPTCVDNDSNFAAQAEARCGNAVDTDDFLYFLINTTDEKQTYAIRSLGASLFLNGKLCRGAHYGAGEIDTLLDSKPYGIVHAEHLLLMADRQGQFTQELHDLADHIADTLVLMTDLIDPSTIIIGGNLGLANEKMLAHIQQRVNEKTVPIPQRHVNVLASAHMDHGVCLGAAGVALEQALIGDAISMLDEDALLAPATSEN
jgi:predicted NBD/HSP70 family sugar kinase